MAGCCGGKNEGKPISAAKYVLGLFIFTGYHVFVQLLLLSLSVFVKRFRKVTGFHRAYFFHCMAEIRAGKGIVISGRRKKAIYCPEGRK